MRSASMSARSAMARFDRPRLSVATTPVPADPLDDLGEPERPKFCGDEGGGRALLEAEFRLGVQRAPPALHLVSQRIKVRHGAIPKPTLRAPTTFGAAAPRRRLRRDRRRGRRRSNWRVRLAPSALMRIRHCERSDAIHAEAMLVFRTSRESRRVGLLRSARNDNSNSSLKALAMKAAPLRLKRNVRPRRAALRRRRRDRPAK